jgi:hypothetical protein
VVAAVDVERRPAEVACLVRQQVGGRGPAVLGLDLAVQRGALLEHRLHRREAGDGARGERADRARGDRVDADVLEAEIPGEVAHGRVERRLGDAHHVVVRHRPLPAEVGHGQDRASSACLHERLRRASARDQGVGADVERQPEAVARSVDEAALEILGGGERDRVDEHVEAPSERLGHLGEDAGDVVVRADVALGDERALDALGQVAHVLLDPLALVREGDLGSLLGEPVRDRPGDGAPVGDAEHERLLSLESACHAGSLNG